jgi:hypothetical protein
LSSDIRGGGIALVLLGLAVAAPAAAQPVREDDPAALVHDDIGSRFLPRADFSFGWASLIAADRRFDWQATVGFDLDVIDYGRGRLRFHGDYEAILGRERRRYDLNQGNYGFEVSGSVETPAVELVAFSQHVSRHVVDRENVPAISWNTFGGRVRGSWTPRRGLSHDRPDAVPGDAAIDGEFEIARAMQQAYVDYAWISRARVSLSRPLSDAFAVIGTAAGEVIGVKRGLARNERVCGGRVEGGVRIRGGAAALEAVVGYERRIDAFPTDRFRVRWFTVGARVVTLGGR